MGKKMDSTEAKEKKRIHKEFMDFVQKFNFVPLAIGFVIGAASKDVVNSLVKDIISPIIGIFLPEGALEGVVIEIANAEIRIGAFLNELIVFFIIAVVVFLVAVKLMKTQIKKK